MMTIGNRQLIHFFHADANAIGANITKPAQREPFSVPSAVSLPPVGGRVTSTPKGFFEFPVDGKPFISADAANSEVVGHFDPGFPVTQAVSLVRRLKLTMPFEPPETKDRIATADSILAQITTKHPLPGNGEFPIVLFGDTHIEKFAVDGKEIEIRLKTDLFGSEKDQKCLKTCHLRDQRLWERVCRQYDDKAGLLQCTLVDHIDLKDADKSVVKPLGKNGLEVANLGKIYFAELVVQYHSYRLTMIRFELGCPVQGDASMAVAASNGHGGGGTG